MRNDLDQKNVRALRDTPPNIRCCQAIPRPGRSAAWAAMLAGAVIAGYVPGTMAGDLGPLCLCPLPGCRDGRCTVNPPSQCCFGHLCCPRESACCSGTFKGVRRETCIYPDLSDCCSGIPMYEGGVCCSDEALNNVGQPYGCPPGGWECCDGTATFESACTPPGYECCRFGHGEAAPDAGACCRDGVGGMPNYVCWSSGEDCCKGACCGGDYPTCCKDIPDPPPPNPPYPGYCCSTGDTCCQGECCGGDTPVCCTDGTDPFLPPQYCCRTGESCCGGGCCAGECLTSPVDEEIKECCDAGVTTLCVYGDQATCCDGQCCGPAGQQVCCERQACRKCGPGGCEPAEDCSACGPLGTVPMPRCIGGVCGPPLGCGLEPPGAPVSGCPGSSLEATLNATCAPDCPGTVTVIRFENVPWWIEDPPSAGSATCPSDTLRVYIILKSDAPVGASATITVVAQVDGAECQTGVTVSVMGPDIAFEGVPEEEELDPGGFLALNDDNDDPPNAQPDLEQTETLGHQVPNEDDLRYVTLTIDDYDPGATVKLNHVLGLGRIKVYEENPPASGNLVRIASWPRVWGPGTFTSPTKVWVEGVQVSLAPRDIGMTLRYEPPGGGFCTDQIKMTVVDADLAYLEFTSDHDLLMKNPTEGSVWGDSAVPYEPIEWILATRNNPISQTKNTSIIASVHVSVRPAGFTFTLVGDGSEDYLRFSQEDYSGGTYNDVHVTAGTPADPKPLPDQVCILDKTIAWKVQVGSATCDLPSSGPHRIYVTYGVPAGSVVTERRVQEVCTSADSQSTPEGCADAVFAGLSGDYSLDGELWGPSPIWLFHDPGQKSQCPGLALYVDKHFQMLGLGAGETQFCRARPDGTFEATSSIPPSYERLIVGHPDPTSHDDFSTRESLTLWDGSTPPQPNAFEATCLFNEKHYALGVGIFATPKAVVKAAFPSIRSRPEITCTSSGPVADMY